MSVHNFKKSSYIVNDLFIDPSSKLVTIKKNDGQHSEIYLFENYTKDVDFSKLWSFIIWYMDKNRPLPGEVFDPYRQQDFERRKAEGFPRPLYPSNILTPEATEQQQKEREQIGGW